jgi:hypothetical protein
MSQHASRPVIFYLMLPLLLLASAAQAASSECDAAWAAYQEFKERTTMEASQYPLTAQGAAVRAACGADALPAPADADINPVRPRVRKPRVPPPKPHDVPPPVEPRRP